jgi:DTW domain-containing protein YfiP
MTTYLGVGAVRIQTWLAHTPKLTHLRGASQALHEYAANAAVQKWLDAHAPTVTIEPSAGDVDGVVALDGTWSQAKSLWWRNPWMLKLGRAIVHPREPSIYGKLRKEPRHDAVSTLESVADALVANGEPEALRADLRRAFRTMVQRARDALGAQALAAPPEAPEDD